MAQDTTASAQEQTFMEVVKPTGSFSASKAIGGRLRALYDDHARQSPSRITELLDALDRD
jgi:hypothetical protein